MLDIKPKEIQKLYIAFFGRPADPIGIDYWLSSTNKTLYLCDVAKALSNQKEYLQTIHSPIQRDLQINQFYLNLFGRKADFEGLNYWLSHIENNSNCISEFVCDLIWIVENHSFKDSEQGKKDLLTLENKVNAAELFTGEIRSSICLKDSYQPKSLNPWNYGEGLLIGVDFLRLIKFDTQISVSLVNTYLSEFNKLDQKNIYPIIKLENISLEIPVYCLEKKTLTKLLTRRMRSYMIGGQLKTSNHKTKIEALSSVNLIINKGERVALIGHNGSGKSSFLKLISGIYKPTSGKLKVDVDVYPMLQKSFLTSSDLSGIDACKAHYLLMNSSLNDFDIFLEDIINFSGLGSYISLPIKTYSEGMCARLIFSILTSISHDCLAIDEGFGAGDAEFFERADQRMKTFINSAGTLFLASHSEQLLRQFCTRGIVFNHGRIVFDGSLDAALNYYHTNDYYQKKIDE